MRYQIPQFIEEEDKIIGPFTLKQFFYLITVPALCYGLHFIVKMPYVIAVGVIFFPFGVMLAFVKINGRPFLETLLGLFHFAAKPQLYLWQKMGVTSETASEKALSKMKKGSKKGPAKTSSKKMHDLEKLAKILDNPEKNLR